MISIRNKIGLTAALSFGLAAALAQDEQTDPLTPQQIIDAAPEDVWRSLDPENTIYMDLPAGVDVEIKVG